MSECQPRLSGVHVFIPSSKSFLLLWFLVSLACLLCGRPALAQQPPGDVDTPITVTGILHLTFRTLFRPSDAIFEEPRVESGAGAIYRPFHAL
jgi:hypothetical protein